MVTAVLALTREGLVTAKKVRDALAIQGDYPVHLYLPEKMVNLVEHNQEGVFLYKVPLKEQIPHLFSTYRALICVMALGIVVRLVGPLARDKGEDPAIVVLDEKGRFVISVLSGHLGGANELTIKLAEALSAQPVITTATDVQGKLAVDVLAQRWDMAIEPQDNIKVINSAVLDGQQVTVFYEESLPENLPDPYVSISMNQGVFWNQSQKGVYITNKVLNIESKESIFLRPKNLVVGVGCRRGCPVSRVQGAITKIFQEKGLSLKSIKALATVDIKRDEAAITETARDWGIPVMYFSAEAINDFWIQALEAGILLSYSEYVQQQIGVGGVCEPTALMSWPGARLIVPKTSYQGVTVAVTEVS